MYQRVTYGWRNFLASGRIYPCADRNDLAAVRPCETIVYSFEITPDGVGCLSGFLTGPIRLGSIGLRRSLFDPFHEPPHRIGPIRYARRLRRREAVKGGMRPNEVVVHEVQSDRVGVIEQLLAKAVGLAGEPAYRHAHGQVLTLDQ